MLTRARQSAGSGDNERFERKFVATMACAEVEAIVKLHPAMFVPSFPPRYVNNIYFDTPELGDYHANLDGQSERRKVRIRWYGPLRGTTDGAVLEFKSKRGLLGGKTQYRLGPFDFDDTFDHQQWGRLLTSSDLPRHTQQPMRGLRPTLANRYRRQYFQTTDRCFRLTIDDELTYYPMQPVVRTARRSEDRHHTIVELKYDQAWDDRARRITHRFPFRLSRHSKYVTGLESVWGYSAACPPGMTGSSVTPAPQPFPMPVPGRRAA